MNGSDHCPECFCEQFEETCSWTRMPVEQRRWWTEKEFGSDFAS